MRYGVALFLFVVASAAAGQCVTTCGTERWDIKTGCDSGAAAIDLGHAIDTTIADLRGLQPPAALAIDPDLVNAATRKILRAVEKGDIENAYLHAKDLLKRRPENGDAHFTMSYTLRYAGLLKESALECERARTLDPTNSAWRSCYVPFLFLGDIPRAKQYIALDGGSHGDKPGYAHRARSSIHRPFSMAGLSKAPAGGPQEQHGEQDSASRFCGFPSA